LGTTPIGPVLICAPAPKGLNVDPSFGRTPTGPSGGRRPKGLNVPDPSFGTTPTGPSFMVAPPKAAPAVRFSARSSVTPDALFTASAPALTTRAIGSLAKTPSA